MNEHMRKALKVNEFATIEFRMASYELARAVDGMALTLDGTLTLGGVEKPITVAAQVKGADDGRLLVTGTHEVRMTEFGLKAPKLMLGTMRVDERIKVGFEIVLKD
jgi:polyisoprenoid-binding protein YceI